MVLYRCQGETRRDCVNQRVGSTLDSVGEATVGCSQAGRGVVARRHPLNLQMGLGHEGFNEELMGWTSDFHYGETSQRRFYQRWAQLMAAESWSEI